MAGHRRRSGVEPVIASGLPQERVWNPIRAVSLNTPTTIPDHRKKRLIGWYCEPVSEGCVHCLASIVNQRVGTGISYHATEPCRSSIVPFVDVEVLRLPMQWKVPSEIEVCSLSDLFGDFVQDEWIDKVFAVMALTPRHTFKVSTKHPARMREYLTGKGHHQPPHRTSLNFVGAAARRSDIECEMMNVAGEKAYDAVGGLHWPLPNAWMGVSIENQETADARLPILLTIPAAIRYIAAQPLLDHINILRHMLMTTDNLALCSNCGHTHGGGRTPSQGYIANVCHYAGCRCARFAHTPGVGISWVTAGYESGPRALPSRPDIVGEIRDQCLELGVPFHFSGWGTWLPGKVFSVDDGKGGRQGGFVKHEDGSQYAHGGKEDFWWDGDAFEGTISTKVGAKASGRLLDGRTWDERPATHRG